MNSFSIVIPAYNEGANLEAAIGRLMEQMETDRLDPGLILVDDGSQDDTWERMLALRKRYPETVCVKLSRNFGKEAAVFAGIAQVKTECCIVMDADMQHPPKVIRSMLDTMADTGADIVEGYKSNRGRESLAYKLFAKGFYRLLRAMGGIDLGNSSDFKLFNRKVIDTVNSFRESSVFFRGLMEWSGFERACVSFDVEERRGGKSSFSTVRRMRFAVNSILAYTSKPLYLTIVVGLLFLLGAVALGIQTLAAYFTGQAVDGFTTVIILILITGSLILLSLGIIGAYISRIYEEVKARPRYIISERKGNCAEGDEP